jgi:ferredoxin-NADP reductase
VSASFSATAVQATRQPGLLRRLVGPLIESSVYDFWVGKINPSWSWARPLAKVIERRVEALDTVTLVLKPNRQCGSFQPGQHINVSAEVNGRRTTRSYSLTGVPQRNGHLSITVKRVEGGKLSTHLCQHAQVGDVLELGPAFGAMTLPAQAQGQWLFLAAGSGITPLMSLTRALAQQGMPADLTLIYWAKTRAELCFIRELRELALKQPRFTLHVVLTHEVSTLEDESTGFISTEQLAQLAGDLSGKQVYACGPGGFVDTARTLCTGVSRSFMAEGFTPSAPAINAPDAVTRTVRVHLNRSGRNLAVSTGMSLLEALEAHGLNPQHGCRMGVCHTCACTRTAGTTVDTQTGEQDTETGMDVRLCVSRACTDLSLDL